MKRILSSELQPHELKHNETLRALIPECMVLLRSDGTFPLTSPCPVALYGAGARKTVKGGTGSGDVNVRHFVTIEEGLERAGFTITSKPWLDAYDAVRAQAQEAFFAEIRSQAEETGKSAFFLGMGAVIPEPEYDLALSEDGDAAVYVVARTSGEGSDRNNLRGDFRLSETEIRDIRWLRDHFSKFLLVLNTGGIIDLSEVGDVENILLLSQLGTETGNGFADVLLGKSVPSGKLTATWAAAEDYDYIRDFGDPDDTRYREGIYVGYRYFDTTGKEPLFPFGFGLSYTTFFLEAGNMRYDDALVSVNVRITNTGKYPGKETIQMYYSAPQGGLDHPQHELGAFAKTGLLAPGEVQELTLSMNLEQMASYDPKRSEWVLESGVYRVWIGNDSRQITDCGGISISERIAVEKTGRLEGDVDFEDWRPKTWPEESIDSEKEAFTVGSIHRHQRAPQNRKSRPSNPSLSSMTREERILTCLGKYDPEAAASSIIGNASFAVAGAAGETSDVLTRVGAGKLIMADGPAGLRLTTEYRLSEDGAQPLDLGSMEMYMDLMDPKVREMIRGKLLEDRKEAEVSGRYWQYCSAIPIGTAVAQSWNTDLAQKLGDIIGCEMEVFGVQLWLAPALNIHRSPLCGRNFEYYSEDPLIAGRIAAAVTRGVQNHPGCGVTIKHFCANNQETNRFRSNSMVSERALREIYLKAFEIAVKEGHPHALMTSYNLLNGEHTCCRKDLLHDVLREEWGYNGIVMTDWHVTNATMFADSHYPSASAAGCVRAGNDLIMPGNPSDFRDIEDALNREDHPYHLCEKELDECVARVLALTKALSKERK